MLDVVFVIPVQNGQHSARPDQVALYLNNTLSSISRVKGDVRAIVVGHAGELEQIAPMPTVTFARVPAGHHLMNQKVPHRSRHFDKSLKVAVGAAVAHSKYPARYLVPVDADDLVHSGVVAMAKRTRTGKHGALCRRGLHAQTRAEKRRVAVKSVYAVPNFHLSCGTCRVFNSGPLFEELSSDPAFQVASAMVKVADWDSGDWWQSLCAQWWDTYPTRIMERIAKHVRQEKVWEFRMTRRIMFAKCVGHANHHGPNTRAGRLFPTARPTRLSRLDPFVGVSGIDRLLGRVKKN